MPVQSQLEAAKSKVEAWKQAALTKYQHNSADLHLIGETIGPPTQLPRINVFGAPSNSQTGISPYPAREDHVHASTVFNDAWASWNPVVTATTTNPVQGSGGTSGGAFCQVNKWVVGQGQWSWGTSGTGFGVGSYEINLPVTPRAIPPGMTVSTCGYGWIAHGGVVTMFVLRMVTSPRCRILAHGVGTTGCTPTTPFVFANGDAFFIILMYEAA